MKNAGIASQTGSLCVYDDSVSLDMGGLGVRWAALLGTRSCLVGWRQYT